MTMVRVSGFACFAMLMTALAVSSQRAVAAAVSDSAAQKVDVDLRPIFQNWGLDVRPQGARGTCSVFTVTDAIEYAVASQRRSGVRLSVEFLNWASNRAIGENADGGFFSDLWKGFSRYGICPEKDLPYQSSFDPKLRPGEEALRHASELRNLGLRLHWIKPWDVKTGLTDEHLAQIKRTLRERWPVCGGFRWPIRQRWVDGVLQMATPEGVRDGHSVLLVGFRDDPKQPGGGVFIFRNTSGASRHGLMTYEYARAYMNDAMWIDYEPASQGDARP